jgi:hypothetical protein
MPMKGFVHKDCAFAGHFLGECSAPASIADVLHISAGADVVFYCGITMQHAVEHDSENCFNLCHVDGEPKLHLTIFQWHRFAWSGSFGHSLPCSLLEIAN